MTESTLTPAKLWKRMNLEQRLAAARAFWAEEQAADDKLQAVLLISQLKKFRPKTVLQLDDERKAKHFASLPSLSEAMAARALVVYHLAEQRAMMGEFLNALGIAHDNGLIQDDEVKPALDKLRPAADAIAQKFPASNVSLYLNTLLCQDPATWGGLAGLPQLQ
jgi:hypothetical protein